MLPLSRSDREWSFLDVCSVKSGLVIATWAFMFGGTTANYLGFWDGLLAMLIGNAIGVILLVFAAILPATKWGTEYFVHQRSTLGARGAQVLALISVAPGAVLWAAILATTTGRAAVELAKIVPGGSAVPENLVAAGVATGFLALAWTFVVRGNNGVRAINRLAAPLLLLMCVWLIVAVLSRASLAEVTAAPALAPTPDRATNIMLMIEFNIAGGLSWYNVAANLGRYARTPRAAAWGALVAYVPINVLACSVGLASALVLGSPDPVAWMAPSAGPILGALLLGLLALANLSTLAAMAQGNCQTLIQHLGRAPQRLGWARFTAIYFAAVLCVSWTAPQVLYDQFFTIVAFLQALVGPAVAVALADALILRRNRLDIAALHARPGTGAYAYWGGINLCAFIAIAVGAITYLAMFNPATLATAPGFSWVSASLPAMLLAFATHIVLNRLIMKPAGKGAY